MPEISRFYGIVIKLFFGDHDPPHFHAAYGEHEVLVGIESFRVIAGSLPPRGMDLVAEWVSLHQEELREAWARAKNLEPVGKIDPLA
jgi:hypothetical protein